MEELKAAAKNIAAQVRADAAAANTELSEIAAARADLDARERRARDRIDAAVDVDRREAAFGDALSKGEKVCANCMVQDGKKVPLTALPGGTDTQDFFRCPACSAEFSETF